MPATDVNHQTKGVAMIPGNTLGLLSNGLFRVQGTRLYLYSRCVMIPATVSGRVWLE